MKIVEIAKSYLGKKEKPNNSGFVDPEMERELREVGWVPGWCACILEVIVWKTYPEKKESIRGLFVPSAVNTYRNLLRVGYKSSLVPTVGSLVFWQRIKEGVKQWQGHCGVVVEVISGTEFISVEGNTNESGSREGDGFYQKRRTVKVVENGLQVIGFIEI
jgi:hypothetical protein